MKIKLIHLTFLLLFLPVVALGQTNSWNGIVPLHSTKSDVEKIDSLKIEGECPRPGNACHYILNNQRIWVNYARGGCKGSDSFDVPKDTVLSISVDNPIGYGKSLDELKLDKNELSSKITHTMTGYWTNSENGVTYTFSQVHSQLASISYIPKKSDNDLRCYGFPPYDPDAYYIPLQKIEFFNPSSNRYETDYIYELDSYFIPFLADDLDFNGYVMVYFDRKLTLERYRQKVSRIRKHLFMTRKVNRKRVMIIEGGMRERAEIELYLLHKAKKPQPPAPNPTLASPQFMKHKRKNK
jgi:hypothetical protein